MKTREEDLKCLYLLANAGDQSAYRELLESISRVLRGYLTKTMNPRCYSKELVEDLVQDILLAIHCKRGLYKADKPILPWIFAIARYRFIDFLRAERRRPQTIEWLEKFDAMVSVAPPLLEDEQEGSHLLEGLSDEQKEILRLAKVEGFTGNEIAKRLGMSLSAVKVTIHRSIKSIRKKLKK